MLKIGLVSPFLPEKDGIAIYSNNLINSLGKNRKEVITIGRKESKAEHIIDFKSFSFKKDLEKIIKEERLNLIHIQYVASFFSKIGNLNLIKALNLDIPFVVTLHEVNYSIGSTKDKVLELIERSIIKKSKAVIAHTPKQKEFLEKKYKSNNIHCIYHGLNIEGMHERKDNNMLCFGMISKGKGVKYLIRAMEFLPTCNLVITGRFVDKKTEREIKNELKNSRSNIKSEFGWIEESKKSYYYNQADLVVLPHIWAPYQSGILHNAISYGIPVVATKTGALWEMVDKFKFGEIVEPKNPKELAKGIKTVFENYEEYRTGIIKYRNEANWPKVAKNHLELYQKINTVIGKNP